MRFKLKEGIAITPEIQAWLDKASEILPSDEEYWACLQDQAIFGRAMFSTEDGKIKRLPPEDWLPEHTKPTELEPT